jgi:hypothetical protein
MFYCSEKACVKASPKPTTIKRITILSHVSTCPVQKVCLSSRENAAPFGDKLSKIHCFQCLRHRVQFLAALIFIRSKTKTGGEIIDLSLYPVDASRDRRLKARYRRRHLGEVSASDDGMFSGAVPTTHAFQLAVELSHLRQPPSLRTSSQLRPERLANVTVQLLPLEVEKQVSTTNFATAVVSRFN